MRTAKAGLWLITYCPGEVKKRIRDVKVVEVECIKQHMLLMCVFDLKKKLGLKCKVKPVKRCKVGKLKQAETKAISSERVQARAVLMRQEPEMLKWYASI